MLSLTLSHVLLEREKALNFELRATKRANQHISDVALLLAAVPSSERLRLLSALPQDEWAYESHQHLAPPTGFQNPRLGQEVGEALNGKAIVESAWTDPIETCATGKGCLVRLGVQISFADGQKLALMFRVKHDHSHRGSLLPLIRDRYLPFILVMGFVSWWIVRLALRPIDRMRDAMEGLGRDITLPPLPVVGPIELRRTLGAFNQMQAQIRAFLAERTEILAAITHDLKTPLTRMRLRLEDLDDGEVKLKLHDDLLFMQTLIDEGLELAKSHHSSEPRREIELTYLIQSICDDLADAGQNVVFEGAGFKSGMTVFGQAFSLRRVFENLIDNAVKYGQHASIRVQETNDKLIVTITDQGPGIPESMIESVLEPFVRLEHSRSRETGGTGLGLAIASNLLHSQGGSLSLRNVSSDGGLEVTVELVAV